jgi:hypothetical protein
MLLHKDGKFTMGKLVFSLYNSMFGDFDDHIYPIELEIKDTTDTTKSASSLDLHFEIASVCRYSEKTSFIRWNVKLKDWYFCFN